MCEEQHKGVLVDDYTCEVYYKLVGLCLLFDSTNGMISPYQYSGCGNYPNVNPYQYAKYELINIPGGASLKRISSTGLVTLRELNDPFSFLQNLKCDEGFCENNVWR